MFIIIIIYNLIEKKKDFESVCNVEALVKPRFFFIVAALSLSEVLGWLFLILLNIS